MTHRFLSRLPLILLGVLACFFLVAPLVVILPLSFTESREMQWPPVGFTTQWYGAARRRP